MNEVVNAEYRVEQQRTLPVIASEILQIERNVFATAMDGAIQIGQKLQEAKDKVEHGEWESWCQENLNYSPRKAREFMQIADNYGNENSVFSKWRTSAEVSISKALKLLTVPEEEVETFVENHDIEDMTVKELEAEIKQLKQDKQDAYDMAAKAEQELMAAKTAKTDALMKLKEAEKQSLELRKKLDEEMAKASAPANSEEIENLKKLLAKAETAQLKAEDDLKKSEEQFDLLAENAEQDAKEAKEKEAKAKAEGIEEGKKQAETEAAQLKEENEALTRRLEAVQDTSKIRMAGMIDSMQKTFEGCIELMCSMGAEDKEKTKAALRTVLDNLKGRLE